VVPFPRGYCGANTVHARHTALNRKITAAFPRCHVTWPTHQIPHDGFAEDNSSRNREASAEVRLFWSDCLHPNGNALEIPERARALWTMARCLLVEDGCRVRCQRWDCVIDPHPLVRAVIRPAGCLPTQGLSTEETSQPFLACNPFLMSCCML
jgi:hypothetical protein